MSVYFGLVDEKYVPEGYSEYLWTSKGCVNAIEYCKRNELKYNIIANFWQYKNRVDRGMGYLESCKHNILKVIAGELNDYLSEDNSLEQWNLLLGSWMDAYLATLYDKYLRLCSVKNTADIFDCKIPDIEVLPVIGDLSAFLSLLFNGDYLHHYIYGLLIDAMGIRFNHTDIEKVAINTTLKEKSNNTSWKSVLLQNFYGFFSMFWGRNIQTVVKGTYLPPKLELKIFIKSFFRSMFYNYSVGMHTDYISSDLDEVWRIEPIHSEEFGDEFQRLAYSLYRRTIPKVYVEDYHTLLSKTKQIYKNAMRAERIFYSCGQVESDELFKLYLKEMRKTKAHFYCIQHGGDYGLENNMISRHEYSTSDTFVTWGWDADSKENCRFLPMPAPKLLNLRYHKSRYDACNEKTGRDILYVSYTLPRNLSRLRCNEAFYETDREGELTFLSRLPDRISERMIARPYMFDYGWHVKESMKNANGNIEVNNEGSYYEALFNAKLVVASYWSTTAVEALCFNIPTIVRRVDQCLEVFARSDYDEMVEAGIIVKSFDDLLKSLMLIAEDVDKWWNDKKRRLVVEKIRKKYAFMPDNASELWIKELVYNGNCVGTNK